MLLNALKRLFRRPGTSKLDFQAVYGLYQKGRLDEAERACRALTAVPGADIDYLQGLIEQKRGDLARAADSIANAVAARANEPSFHYSLAEVLAALGRHVAAIDHAERFLALTPANDPRRAYACVAAGKSAANLRESREATRWFKRAIAEEPRPHVAAILVADALYEQSMIEEAREALEAPSITGGYPIQLRRALMLPAIYESVGAIEAVRERLARELDELSRRPAATTETPEATIGILPFYLAYHDRNNEAPMRQIQAAMRRAYAAPNARRSAQSRTDGKVRVGFVSNFFYSHSIGRTTIGHIRDLPRGRFAVHVFAVEPRDDALRRQIESAADHYHRLPNVLDAVRRTIEESALDVLVFADIGMHPLTYFLALSRLAPLQIVAWGHPETTGIDTVDSYLAAPVLAGEETAPLYSEPLLIPQAFFLPGYARPQLAERVSRVELDLPEDRHLYACMQPLFKLHPDMDAIFLGILERDPQGEIVLLESRPTWADQIGSRFTSTLAEHARRVRFLPEMPHQQFLATLAACDVALDPLYFGGTNSSCEALALGVPVVTLPGAHLYGRFTLAMYREMQFDQCIASSVTDYVDKAVRLANDAEFGTAARHRILECSGVLFQRTDATLALADFIAKECAHLY